MSRVPVTSTRGGHLVVTLSDGQEFWLQERVHPRSKLPCLWFGGMSFPNDLIVEPNSGNVVLIRNPVPVPPDPDPDPEPSPAELLLQAQALLTRFNELVEDPRAQPQESLQ